MLIRNGNYFLRYYTGLTVFICFLTYSSLAQIVFEDLPQNLAFIPRNEHNIGEIKIKGHFQGSENITLRSVLIKMENDSVLEEKIVRYDFTGTFNYTHQLEAALQEYKLLIYAKLAKSDSLLKEIKHLVCGDVFLIGGQSNALDATNVELEPAPIPAHEGETLNQTSFHNKLYSHYYCRAIGYAMNFIFENTKVNGGSEPQLNDYSWARPSCVYWENGFVGAWGIKLQHELTDTLGVPICFVNGAFSGAKIERLLPSNEHLQSEKEDLSIPYDRVYSKLKTNGLAKFVKGIFWYQGEADGALAYEHAKQYTQHFYQLYQTWKADYPNCQKVFLLQTNTACGGLNLGLVRGQQAQLAEELVDVEIMSTVGSKANERNLSDACHNTLLGSNRIAEKMFPLVLNGLYGLSYPKNLFFPPKVIKASYTSQTSQISISFDQNIYLQTPRSVSYSANSQQKVWVEEKLEHYFFDEYGKRIQIQDLKSSGNQLLITLKPEFCRPKKITYLPSTYYDEAHYPGAKVPVYAGPWIMNQSNTIGALTFHDLKLDCANTGLGDLCCNSIQVFPNPSNGEITVMSADTKKKELILFNTSGEGLLRTEFSDERFNMNLSQYPRGLYLIEVLSENEDIKRIKLILED